MPPNLASEWLIFEMKEKYIDVSCIYNESLKIHPEKLGCYSVKSRKDFSNQDYKMIFDVLSFLRNGPLVSIIQYCRQKKICGMNFLSEGMNVSLDHQPRGVEHCGPV